MGRDWVFDIPSLDSDRWRPAYPDQPIVNAPADVPIKVLFREEQLFEELLALPQVGRGSDMSVLLRLFVWLAIEFDVIKHADLQRGLRRHP